MKSIKILCVAAGLATLSACGGNTAANNVDANASLENVDAGLTPVDTIQLSHCAILEVYCVIGNSQWKKHAFLHTPLARVNAGWDFGAVFGPDSSPSKLEDSSKTVRVFAVRRILLPK